MSLKNRRCKVRIHRHIARPPFAEMLEERLLMTAINLALSGQTPTYTNLPTPMVVGTVDDPAAEVMVAIIQGGDTITTLPAQTDGLGDWSLTLPALTDGTYDLSITATDNGGADSGELDVSNALVVDTVLPGVAENAGELPAVTDQDVTLTGTYNDAHISSVAVTLNDGHGGVFNFNAVLDTGSSTWSAPIAIGGLGDGTYSATVTATDLAGNVTQVSSGQLTVDTTVPAVGIDAGQLPVVVNSDTVLTGTYSDANISSVVVKLDDGHGGTFDFNAAIDPGSLTWSANIPIGGLSEEAYSVSVTATDLAGNAAAVAGGTLTVDLTAPTVNIDAGQLPATVNSGQTLTGTYGDANIGSVVVTLDNGEGGTFDFTAAVDAGTGTWSVPVSIAGVGDGDYAVTVKATDLAGNTTSISAGVLTVDTIPPAVSVTHQISNVGNPTLTGTVGTDATSLSVTVAGVTYTSQSGDVVVAGDGGWSLVLPSAPDGDYAVSVTASDAVGNMQTVSGDVLIDTTAPAVALDGGQLPVTTKSNVTLTGTYVDANIASILVTLDNGSGGVFNFPATVGGNGTWSAVVAGLPEGTYAVSITAADVAANTTTIGGGGSFVVDLTPPAVTVGAKVTNDSTPGLSGTIDDPAGSLLVTIHGITHAAVNNGDGTWTLADNTISALPDGVYTVTVTASDAVGNQRTISSVLVVDTAVPVVTVDKLITSNLSPALSGTVNDPDAAIAVTVNGVSYNAVNNGDGTWSLDAGVIAQLPAGTYSVTARATNALGTTGTDTSSNELTIGGVMELTFSSSLNKIIYTDADGTIVTVTATGGAVTLRFFGDITNVSTSGKTQTVTAAGGVSQLEVDVPANTPKTMPALTFSTNTGGDAQTTINQITGGGNLKSLTAKSATIAAGINMTGYIQTLTVHAINSDVQMATLNSGVTITADTISNSAIQTGVISKLTAKLGFLNSTVSATNVGSIALTNVRHATINAVVIKGPLSLANVQDTNVNATTVGSVNMSNVQNTNLAAATIGAVTLTNVQFDNGGTSFGVSASVKLASLKVVEYGTSLAWKKQFLNSVLDFSVLA